MCLHALEKLCRKRPSPVTLGSATTWAAGIVYAVESTNVLFDTLRPIHMKGMDIGEAFGMAASTASAKGGKIRKMLKMYPFAGEWKLPSLAAQDPMFMYMVNGFRF